MSKKDLKMYVTPATEVLDVEVEDEILRTSFERPGQGDAREIVDFEEEDNSI